MRTDEERSDRGPAHGEGCVRRPRRGGRPRRGRRRGMPTVTGGPRGRALLHDVRCRKLLVLLSCGPRVILFLVLLERRTAQGGGIYRTPVINLAFYYYHYYLSPGTVSRGGAVPKIRVAPYVKIYGASPWDCCVSGSSLHFFLRKLQFWM